MLADYKLSRTLFKILQPSYKGKQSGSGFQSNSSTFIKVRTVIILHGEFDESSLNSVTCDCSKLKLLTATRGVHHFPYMFFSLVHIFLAFSHKFCFT